MTDEGSWNESFGYSQWATRTGGWTNYIYCCGYIKRLNVSAKRKADSCGGATHQKQVGRSFKQKASVGFERQAFKVIFVVSSKKRANKIDHSLSLSLSLSIYLSISLSWLLVVSICRFFAVGIDLRWREIALLAAMLVPLAYLATALGPLTCLAAALGPLAWLT